MATKTSPVAFIYDSVACAANLWLVSKTSISIKRVHVPTPQLLPAMHNAPPAIREFSFKHDTYSCFLKASFSWWESRPTEGLPYCLVLVLVREIKPNILNTRHSHFNGWRQVVWLVADGFDLMSWLDILDEDNGWEPMGNQVKVSKSGAVCSCHMGRADVGVPLALCRVQAAFVTACLGPAASRPLNQSSEQRRSAGGAEPLTPRPGWNQPEPRSCWECSLSLRCWWSEPPTSRLHCRATHTITVTTAATTEGIHRITTSNKIELNFLELIDLKLKRCRSTKLQSNQIIKRGKRECVSSSTTLHNDRMRK